jgi:DNA-binding GntR family transcriptional regulator
MLKHKSLKELVYEYLYKKINTGSLRPNEKLNENQICNDLNVSRTPIREALVQLENEGYIKRLQRKGFIVREINQRQIKEIYKILGCLEGLAAHDAVGRLTESDLESMLKLIQKMDDAIKHRNMHQYFETQRNFHGKYISASANDELGKLITSLKKRFMKKAYYQHENEDILFEILQRNNNQHKEILKLFKEKDMKGVEQYLKEVHWIFDSANLIISTFNASNNDSK